MKHKRLFSFHKVAALLICVALLLPGCSNANNHGLDPNQPVSVTIWHYYNGPQQKALEDMVATFNDTVGLEKGVVVEAIGQGNVSQLTEKVLDAANKKVGAEEVPQIFAAYADTAYQLDTMGLVAELDPYFTKDELAQYRTEYLDEGRLGSDGKLKIFPFAKSTEIMMLNKTDWEKFASGSGASLNDLSTMEGLVTTAQKYYEWTDSLTEAANDGKSFWGRDAMANYFVIGCKQLGVEIFAVENGASKINPDKDVLRKLWDNYYIPFVNGWFSASGEFRSDGIKTGDIIAMVNSTSGAAYFPTEVTVGNNPSYPVEPLALQAPVFAGGSKVAVQQGAGMVVTKSDEKTEYAAALFLKWFTETDRNIEFSLSTGYLPVKIEAYDLEHINKIGGNLQDTKIIQKFAVSLPVSLQTIKDSTLYTSKAFQGGYDARNVLEYSLNDLAKADAQLVQAQVDAGVPRSSAASAFTTDTHFEEWYASLVEALNKAVAS